MRYQLKVSLTAYRETDDAFFYYETQSTGLGERFLKSVEEAYSKLVEHPQFYSFINENKLIRDIKVKAFPFVIIYQIVENTVLVIKSF